MSGLAPIPAPPTTLGGRAYLAAGIAATALLAALILAAGTQLRYDEPWYLQTMQLIDQHGLSPAFLRELPGPAGPVYTVVQYLFRPMTGASAPGVRLVNFGLLLATMALSALTCRLLPPAGKSDAPRPSSIQAAFDHLALPMTWVIAGMALTEVPAGCSAALAILAILAAAHYDGATGWALAAIAGVAAAGAVLGRQPWLVLPVAAAVLLRRENVSRLALAALIAGSLVGTVFLIWGGWLPPKTAFVGSGLVPRHGVLGAGYAGIALALLAPRFFAPAWRTTAFLAGAAFLLSLAADWPQFVPLDTASRRLLGPAWHPIYVRTASAMVVAAAAACLSATVAQAWANRHRREYCFLLAAMVLLLATNLAVSHQFSSRYVAQATPVLVLVAAYHDRPGVSKALRLIAGAALGVLCLASYLFFHPSM